MQCDKLLKVVRKVCSNPLTFVSFYVSECHFTDFSYFLIDQINNDNLRPKGTNTNKNSLLESGSNSFKVKVLFTNF